MLGEVTACQGALCKKDDGGHECRLSLPAPPPAYTYQSALAKKAAKQYGIPESDVVIGEMKVGYYAEMIGTIRGWKADAPVGKSLKRSGSMSASSGTGTLPMASPPMRQMVSSLTWTTDRPTKPGWYSLVSAARTARQFVEVQVDDHRSLYMTHTGMRLQDMPPDEIEWAGPLESRRDNGTGQWTAERSRRHERRHRGQGRVRPTVSRYSKLHAVIPIFGHAARLSPLKQHGVTNTFCIPPTRISRSSSISVQSKDRSSWMN